jgi:hypothetical protein
MGAIIPQVVVIAGKVLDEEGKATRFAFVRDGGSEAFGNPFRALILGGGTAQVMSIQCIWLPGGQT